VPYKRARTCRGQRTSSRQRPRKKKSRKIFACLETITPRPGGRQDTARKITGLSLPLPHFANEIRAPRLGSERCRFVPKRSRPSTDNSSRRRSASAGNHGAASAMNSHFARGTRWR
jgi:hypothetical protein